MAIRLTTLPTLSPSPRSSWKKQASSAPPEFNQRKILADMGLIFKIKETAPRKNNKITYAQMVQYISCVKNSILYMAQLDAVREEAKSKNNPYNRVLEWFNKTFPCFYDMPEFNAKNEVIVTPADYLTALPEAV